MGIWEDTVREAFKKAQKAAYTEAMWNDNFAKAMKGEPHTPPPIDIPEPGAYTSGGFTNAGYQDLSSAEAIREAFKRAQKAIDKTRARHEREGAEKQAGDEQQTPGMKRVVNLAPQPTAEEGRKLRNKPTSGFDSIMWGAKRARKIVRRVAPDEMIDGEYRGVWTGLVIVFSMEKVVYELSTGDWGAGQEVIVTVAKNEITAIKVTK